MPGNPGTTRDFINLLRRCSKCRDMAPNCGFLGAEDMHELLKSDHPYNPLENCEADPNRISYEVMKATFDRLLGKPVDWNEVKREAAKLKDEIENNTGTRDEAAAVTRWIPLKEDNDIFDYVEWASVWSRRDLETLLSYFMEEAVYEDVTFERLAAGRTELRKLFSDLFHSWDLDMRVISASVAPLNEEVEIEWTRSGYRMSGKGNLPINLNGSAMAGKSLLQIEGGSIRKCNERWNEADLELIIDNRLGFKAPERSGTVVNKETELIVNGIRVPKAK